MNRSVILSIVLLLSGVSHLSFSNEEKSLYIEYSELGSPAEVLKVREKTLAPLESGQVRVEVIASPIHPANLLQISGHYGVAPRLPDIPGSEGVGRVVELGGEVSALSVGQLVLLVSGNTWQQQIVAPAAAFVPLPGLDLLDDSLIEQLSMVAVNPATALLMLESFVKLKEGDWIVQSASNSAVGSYLIQLATARGINTINVVRREGLSEQLTAIGATKVLIDGPDLAEEIRAAAGDKPVVLAIDAVGGDTFTRLANSLGFGGTIVSYGLLSGKPSTINPRIAIFNDVRVRGFWLQKWYETASQADLSKVIGQLVPLIASGQLRADVDSRYALDQISDAVTRAAEGGRNGKVLIKP